MPNETKTMTEAEFLALPDDTPSFGQREVIIDGRRTVIPICPQPGGRALYLQDDDGLFVLADGTEWITGWIDGRRVRRRLS